MQTRDLIRSDPTLCVLSHISHARGILRGHDEDDICDLVDKGYLLAWDIALYPRDSARELRLLPESIDHYLNTGRKHNFHDTWPGLLMRGHRGNSFRSPTVALILNCGATHVTNLIDAGLLTALPLSKPSSEPFVGNPCRSSSPSYRRGPTGAACVTHQAFLSFMKVRLQ